MISISRSANTPQLPLTIPVILELLQVIHVSICDDVVLSRPARTVERAMDELTSLRQTALDVMCEMELTVPPPHSFPKHINRRRLC